MEGDWTLTKTNLINSPPIEVGVSTDKMNAQLAIDTLGKALERNILKEKCELIQTDNLKELKLTMPGEYWITDQKLSYSSVMVVYFIVIGAVVVLIGVGVYIVLKKKYWFW